MSRGLAAGTLLLTLGACSGSVDSDSSSTTGGSADAETGATGAAVSVGGRQASGGSIGLAGGGALTTAGSGGLLTTGGDSNTGGTSSGGGAVGTGGSGTGGLATGGATTGGSATGGLGGGGAATGGLATGATGGTETGGSAGDPTTGGTETGGTGATSGSGSTGGAGGNPPTGGWGPDVQTGTIGYTDTSPDGDLDRAKVWVDGEQYLIQNNNYGDPENTNLILQYRNNSFVIVEGNGTWSEQPASFPSIYIGANGDTANGVYATSYTDHLPRQITQIASIHTSFAWSGSTAAFATTYDLWFASALPTTEYFDGIDGFVRVWMHDPRDWQPIGSEVGTASVAGQDWDVWVGPRGEGPDGYNNSPVVTFVAQTDILEMTFDLIHFVREAADYGIDSSLYLTDVFFGFEIFTGGAGGGLGVDEFTCVVD